VTGEIVEVWNQVAIGEKAEKHVPVVGNDRHVQPERVIDGNQGPDLQKLGARRVERHLRPGHVGRDQVHDSLPRKLWLHRHDASGERLHCRRSPVDDVGQGAGRDRLA
jgi:hypothetical protein